MKIHGSYFARILALLLALELGLTISVPAKASILSGISRLAAAPQPGSIFPASFNNLVNQPVTITGSNLGGVTSAVLGTTTLFDLQVTSTEIHALVPWDIVPGTYHLRVTNQTGESATLMNAVTITPGDSDWASSGPFGGVLRDVVVDPVAPQHVYTGSQYSGLFRSQDGGANWEMSLLNASGRVQILYPTSGQPPVLYTNIGCRNVSRSTDYGQTWEEKPFHALDNRFDFNCLVYVRPGRPDSVYMAVYNNSALDDPLGGLYESTDQGDTWEIMNATSGIQVSAVAFDPDHDLNIVIGTFNGLVRTSADSGATWSNSIPVALSTITHGFMRLDFSPTQFSANRSLWLTPCHMIYDGGYHCDNSGNPVYRSTDGGQTWSPVTVAENITVRDVAFSDTVPGLMWAAAEDGFYSVDGGDTWEAVGAGLYEVIRFAAVPGAASREATTVFAATQRGLFKSANGGATWQESDTGLGAVLGESIAISPFNADEAYVATRGGSKGVLHTYNGGRSWETLPIPVGDESPLLATDPFVNGKGYFSYNHKENGRATVGVMQNHGQSYTDHWIILPAESADRAGYVATIEPDPRTPGRVLAGVCERSSPGGNGYIYASTDGGVTWEQQATPPGVSCINSIAFDPHWNSACGADPDEHPEEPNMVYATAETSGVLRSTDAGATWTLLAHNPPNNPEFKFVVVDPLDSATLYVRARGGPDPSATYVSHDRGESWPDQTEPAWMMKFVLERGKAWWLYAGWVDGLRINKNEHFDPMVGWEDAPGIAGDAAITGFNAATECQGGEPGRVVYYIGMVGGPVSPSPSGGSSTAGQTGNDLNAGPYIPGGIYRSMAPIDSQPAVPGWELKGIAGANTVITAMEAFNGQIYTGTGNWATGARVWRYHQGAGWSPASEPGMSPDFGAANSAIPDMAVFKGQLYAAVGWGENEGQIWRTGNGADWSQVTDQEFSGNPNYTPSVLAVFQDHLYAFAIGGSGAVQTWRSSTGKSGSWEHILPDGFGNANNSSVTGAAVFNNALYAVTSNSTSGAQVWRTSNGTQWTQANTSGFGASGNHESSGMAVFKGALYVDIMNTGTGGQLWRYNGTSWSKAAPDGFGEPHNQSIGGLYATRYQLYAVTNNQTSGLQVWTSMNGSTWSPSNLNGFRNSKNQSTFWSNAIISLGNQVFVGTFDGGSGGEVWGHNEFFFPVFLPSVRR